MGWLTRISVIFFWTLLIFGALYLPKQTFFTAHKNALNIFAWGDILDPAIVADFEKTTGITVHLNYYSSNEELLVKLKATRGVGYDLIIPSDYAVKILADEGLLKPLDRSRLPFWSTLNPSLLGHFFDPDNRYSIPFSWELFCLGIDKDYFRNRPFSPSWDLIFDLSKIPYKISMTNDPIEAIMFASFYLFGVLEELDPYQVARVKALLIDQKEHVEAYANFRGDYFLATKNCPVVVASSSYIWRTMRQFPFVTFAIPKEGTFLTIENICLSVASTQEREAYEFIQFLYAPRSMATHHHTYGFFPATLNALNETETDPESLHLIRSDQEAFQRFHFIHTLMPDQQLRDLWVAIKSEK
jgi:spermidine/putrescine transport system substrate-binding protein